jgi:aldose 1-epimerase
VGEAAPSGKQFPLEHGDQRAVVVEVGGGLRSFSVGERELIDGYGIDERCTGARGLPLVPWPNRIADGVYSFDGVEYQLPLTEPDQKNAIHGLLRWRNWECREHSPNHVVVGTVLRPMMGYPFTLDVRVAYTLDDQGLSVRTEATNLGASACPYGSGQHPYLLPGGSLDESRLQFRAGTFLPTDARGIPTGRRAVEGTELDFEREQAIGNRDIDVAFTDLARDADGRAWLSFTGADGFGIDLWLDRAYEFLEVYTSHTQPAPHHRTGLGVEPMTCAPDAFRSGDGLLRLEPGASAAATWGIRPREVR